MRNKHFVYFNLFVVFIALNMSFQNCAGGKGTSGSLGASSSSAKSNSSNAVYPNSNSSPFTTSSEGGSSPGGENGCGTSRADFCFEKDLEDLTITLKRSSSLDFGYGTLQVNVASAKGALRYTWYKDSSELRDDGSTFRVFDNTVSISAKDYSADGDYQVVVTENTDAQRTIRSRRIKLKIQEDKLGCDAGTYWASKVDPIGVAVQSQNRFNNKAGKWLLNSFYANPGGYSLSSNANSRAFSIGKANYGAVTTISCTNYVPNLHENKYSSNYPNCPMWTNTSIWGGTTCEPFGVSWAGTINLKCQNNKWVMLSNTCSWTGPTNPVRPAAPDSTETGTSTFFSL